MKALNIVSHPLILILSFAMILIAGEAWAGFYIIYLAMGISVGAIHSIAGFIGIGLLISSLFVFKRQNKSKTELALNLGGVFALTYSIVRFFLSDDSAYNSATFHEPISLATMVLFFVISILFILRSAGALHPRKKDTNHYSLR